MTDSWKPVASLETLKQRAKLLQQIRQFFDEREFIEVETPLLSKDTVIDQHLDPVAVTLPDDPREPKQGKEFFLQTSPEFCMKRVLAAGAQKIYQICKAFRAAESGPLHNPEFTMVEWYRTGDDMFAGMQLLSDLAETTLKRAPATFVTYQEAFLANLELDPHTASAQQLHKLAEQFNIAVPESFGDQDKDALLDLLLVEKVQPSLGVDQPAILYNYPASQAALACVEKDANGTDVAQRFELYVDGIELANGYHELLDAKVLRERNHKINQLRLADGKQALPEESHLIAAMQHGLPPCAGVALGLDRLAMLVTQQSELTQVLPFPTSKA